MFLLSKGLLLKSQYTWIRLAHFKFVLPMNLNLAEPGVNPRSAWPTSFIL